MMRKLTPFAFALPAWLLAVGCAPGEEAAASEPASTETESAGLLRAGDLSNAVTLSHSVTSPGKDTARTVLAAPGDFDPAFIGGGQTFYTVNGFSGVSSDTTLVQPDGKIIVSGRLSGGIGCRVYVARFNADGTSDATFAGGVGLINTQISSVFNCHPAYAALQADGKIVVASTMDTNLVSTASDFVLLRYTANGLPDTTFGTAGLVTHNYATYDSARDVAISATGEILLGGTSSTNGQSNFVLARFSSSGTLLNLSSYDFTLGSNDSLIDIALQPDGKILAVGNTYQSGFYPDFALVRFHSSGLVDTSFGAGGSLRIDVFGNTDQAMAVAVQGDGKILVAGSAYYAPYNTNYMTLFRLNASGNAYDTTFGGTGQSYVNFGAGDNVITKLALQADGKILAAGFVSLQSRNYNYDAALLRLTSAGALDLTFAGGGGFWFDAYSNSHDLTSGVAIQPGGKILFGGDSTNTIRLSRHLN